MTSQPLAQCIWCNNYLNHEVIWQQLFRFKPLYFASVCQNCREAFTEFQRVEPACQTCGRAVERYSGNWQSVIDLEDNFRFGFEIAIEAGRHQTVLCFDCVRWYQQYPLEILNHDAILDYTEAFREWLYRYKYRGDYRLRQVLVEPLRKVYQQYSSYQWLVLPSSPTSIKERGFHATAGLLDAAAIPYESPFIYIGDGRKQASKNRLERLSLVQPFDLTTVNFQKLSQKILIFDDVYTTGATLISAKRILLEKNHELGANVDELAIVSLSLSRDSQINR